MTDTEILLSVRALELGLVSPNDNRIVKSASFDLKPGEVLGLVGESGSGKTMLGRSLFGLQPGVVVPYGGDILFQGRSVLDMKAKDLRQLRGAEIGMVFQEPMTSLNPSMTIGRQLNEPLQEHTDLNAKERRARILEIMERVGIPAPQDRLDDYPHEFSGGMRQRIMLASAMLLKPALLIADEPTTALDALVQRSVLKLMLELTKEEGTALILISHDLPMVAHYCERLLVMRQGEIVEAGVTADILATPQHEYTRNLLRSMPERGPVRPFEDTDQPILETRNLAVEYKSRSGLFGKVD